ncbi:MAG: NAD-dependent epimerase/dehydratase family protein, partial [Opitutaceae bacterium]
MKILITGGAGFLGQRLAKRLLAARDLPVERVVLVDIVDPPRPDDPRFTSLGADIADEGVATRLLADGVDAIVHLAAVVSGQAEADFSLGMRVNLDATRRLLDAARETGRCPRFVFASSVAVFSRPLPDVILEETAAAPKSSYGMQKAVA